MAAGLYAFAHPDSFSQEDFSLLSGLGEDQAFKDHLNTYQNDVLMPYIREIKVGDETVGTNGGDKARKFAPDGDGGRGGDYDFLLKEIIPILYLFKDRADVVTNDMVWLLLSQGRGGAEGLPYTGKELDYLQFDLEYFHLFRMKAPETENHLLMIYGWKYLVNNYVKWAAHLDPGHARYDSRIKAAYDRNPGHYHNNREITDFVLAMLGRIVYNDLFETNAKAYESFSISAIMNFFSFADKVFPENTDCLKVKKAAQNALDYLAAKFAFQSLEGKRVAPMRRNWDYHRSVGYYENDYVPFIFGVLSGAHSYSDYTGEDVYPDALEGSRKSKNAPYFFAKLDQGAGFALWAALLDYRIPDAIHDFMIHKYSGFWSRMQSRYTSDHYGLSLALDPGPGAIRNMADQKPRYFNSDGAIFMSGHFKPVTQFYFVTRDYLNAAGGYFRKYYDDTLGDMDMLHKALKTYHAQSRAYAVITKGDDGYWGKDKDLMGEHMLTMIGNAPYFWESKELATYKNLSFGYLVAGEEDRWNDWPQKYPAAWDVHIAEPDFMIGHACFKIFDFTRMEEHPLCGYYVVFARVRKNRKRGQYKHYARGLWEIVPAHIADSAAGLKQMVEAKNPPSFYSWDERIPYYYVSAVTGEKFQIDNKYGASDNCSAFEKIWDEQGREMDLVDYHVNNCSADSLKNDIGLIDVWQVDGNYQFTGYKYATGRGDGHIEIKNPHLEAAELTVKIDSRDYKNPLHNDPERSCPL
jgi:hypothetical protein